MGKGDTYRPVDRNKYNKGYLRVFGKKCPQCRGKGVYGELAVCSYCRGRGYIEKDKDETVT